jgi:protein-S-isoprenylcysteine O-methyltransferase Ste14
MPGYSLVVLITFSLLGLALIVLIISLRRKGNLFLGKPSIDKFYFYTGKGSLFSCWGLCILKAILPTIGFIVVPAGLSWTAACILVAGSILMLLSMINLGGALYVGLPGSETKLKTGGLYHFSRNPLYSGVYLTCIASCLFFPDLLNLTFAFYGIAVHHAIVKGEESFLAVRFGSEWEQYRKKVRRYV